MPLINKKVELDPEKATPVDDTQLPVDTEPDDEAIEKAKSFAQLTAEQKKFVIANCRSMTVSELSNRFGKRKLTIRKFMARQGILNPIKVEEEESQDEVGQVELQGYDEVERRQFFEAQLKNSLFYKTLQEQFSKDELNYYVEEYGALAFQFADVVATEKRQIDEFIKTQIMLNRLMKYIKNTDDDIEKMAQRIDEHRKNNDLQKDEQAQLVDQGMLQITQRMAASAQQMGTEVQKLVKQKNELLEHLNARRKDRTNQIEQSKSTFLGLVEAFRDKEVKKAQGDHLAMLNLAKNKKMKEWRNTQNVFPDGSKSAILIDAETNFDEIAPATKNFIDSVADELAAKTTTASIDDKLKEQDKKIAEKESKNVKKNTSTES